MKWEDVVPQGPGSVLEPGVLPAGRAGLLRCCTPPSYLIASEQLTSGDTVASRLFWESVRRAVPSCGTWFRSVFIVWFLHTAVYSTCVSKKTTAVMLARAVMFASSSSILRAS